jgi:6-phosphogluconolactonase (cycloisomerase 2 family)
VSVNGAELVFVGCYTPDGGGVGEGIVSLRRDPATGALSGRTLAARTPSPSFLAAHPARPVLYAVNELAEGTVSAWSVAADGALSPLGVRRTGGAHPCHLAVTPDGGHLLVANYGSGSVSVLPLDAAGVPGERTDLVQHDGSGPVADRQEGPHAHQVVAGTGEVLAVDLGADRLFRHRLDGVTGRLAPDADPVRVPAGAGPRHAVRHPDGGWFVAAELAATVTAFRPDPVDGGWRPVGSVPASGRPAPVFPSEIVLGADGRFGYVGNRGPDTVTVFTASGGALSVVAEVPCGGVWPRHLALVEHHLYVANERSHTVAIFEVGIDDGVPRAAGEPVAVPSATCVLRWPPAATLA